MMPDDLKMFTVLLAKGEERYIVKYEAGSEPMALDTLVSWANNPELRFDWFDAAIMSKQIGLNMGGY